MYEHLSYGSDGERRLQRAHDASVTKGATLGVKAFGLVDSPDRDAFAAARLSEEQQADATVGILQKIESEFYAPRYATLVRSAADSLASLRSWILIAFGFVLVVGLLNAFAMLRGAFREEREVDERDVVHKHEQFRSDLENQLQRGLEMEPNEEATYSVIGRRGRHWCAPTSRSKS